MPARVAVARLLTRPVVTAPITGATPQQLDDLIAGTQLELDEAAIGLLDAASA